jgi:hypothetical protein
MKIYQDINLSEFKFWSGAKTWAAEFTSEELDEIGEILENDGYAPEGGWTDTAVNDLFWFEPEFVAGLIGKIIPDLAGERFDAAISAVEDEIRNYDDFEEEFDKDALKETFIDAFNDYDNDYDYGSAVEELADNLFDDIADDEEDKDALIRFLDKAKIKDYL